MLPPCRIAALTAALALMPVAHGSDAVYKWIDSDGVTHYAQQPPMDRDAQRLDPGSSTGASAPPPGTEPEPSPPDDEAADDASDGYPNSVTEYCEQMRQRVETLASDARVQLRNDDGSLQPIEGEERAKRLEQGRSQIAEHCGDATS